MSFRWALFLDLSKYSLKISKPKDPPPLKKNSKIIERKLVILKPPVLFLEYLYSNTFSALSLEPY